MKRIPFKPYIRKMLIHVCSKISNILSNNTCSSQIRSNTY